MTTVRFPTPDGGTRRSPLSWLAGLLAGLILGVSFPAAVPTATAPAVQVAGVQVAPALESAGADGGSLSVQPASRRAAALPESRGATHASPSAAQSGLADTPAPPSAALDDNRVQAAASPGLPTVSTTGSSAKVAAPASAFQAVVTAARAPAQGEAPTEPTFSERALGIVRVLADDIGSRPAGTEAERRAASYLADELRAMGYAVDTPSFRYSVRSGSGTSQNVVATSSVEDPNAPLVVIGAHYDSVAAGPGANDNGSGTATMVEVARDLARNPVPGVAVRFVAFGAEEIGLLGSAEYARQLTAAERVRLRVMISIDMMAVGDQPAFGGSQPWVADAMARAASQGYRPVDLSSTLRRLSDHASFLDADLPAVMFHWVDDPFYHTRLDVSPNVQWWSLDLMGAIAVELVRLAAAR